MSAQAGRTFFSIAAVLTFAIGAAWLLAPVFMFDQWSVTDPSPIAVYMARRYATLFFGYTVLLWLSRDAATSPAGRPIVAGGTVVSSSIAVVSAWGVLSGVVGPVVWLVTALEVALAAGFARIWFRS